MDQLPHSGSPADVPAPAGGQGAPALDRADYADDLDELGLTAEQEAEFLETLWSIMAFFARSGFEVDVCGLILGEFNRASAPEAADGNLKPSDKLEKPSGSGKERATT